MGHDAGTTSPSGGPNVGGVVVAVLGFVLLAIPLMNVYRDLTLRGNPLYATLLESSASILFAGLVIVAGIWLVRSEAPMFARTVARWVGGITLVVTLTVAWTLGVQFYIQGGLKPLALAGDTLIVGAIGGLGVGIYNARVKRKQEELRAERDRFSALFENVPNSVVSVRLEDGDPVVDSVNPAFEEVFGFVEGELRGKNLNDYVVPATADSHAVEPTTERSVDADRERGEWEGNEVTLKTQDGLRDFIRMTAPVIAPTEQDKYGIYIDITERKQRKERLRVLSRILRHNIRNKLTVIMGHAERLEKSRASAAIMESAEQLATLSERTVDIERVASGDLTLRTMELQSLVDRALENVDANHDDWTRVIDCPSDEYVQATTALTAAIQELIENAIEHADQEVPRVEIHATQSPDGAYYELVVADNGPGIPEMEIEEMLDGTAASQINHATGIGLWAVNWIVSDAGGELTFEERASGGTAVTVRLKRASEDGEEPTVTQRPDSGDGNSTQSPATTD